MRTEYRRGSAAGQGEQARAGHLKAYYDEFEKRVETVEAADRMTDHQIASKIRAFFSKKPSA